MSNHLVVVVGMYLINGIMFINELIALLTLILVMPRETYRS
jgi:hypothetical protein